MRSSKSVHSRAQHIASINYKTQHEKLARQQPKSINLICVPRREKQAKPRISLFSSSGQKAKALMTSAAHLFGGEWTNERRWEMSREIITLDGGRRAHHIARRLIERNLAFTPRACGWKALGKNFPHTEKTAFLSECIPQIFVSWRVSSHSYFDKLLGLGILVHTQNMVICSLTPFFNFF